MELKLKHAIDAPLDFGMLLIEPLWNWNRAGGATGETCRGPFNRTTMELKRLGRSNQYQPIDDF